MKKQTKILVVAMVIILGIGLIPEIHVEAAKKKVYVLTQIHQDNFDQSGLENWGSWSTNISYDKNGLVKKISDDSIVKAIFKYDDEERIIRIQQRNGYYSETLAYNNKGHVKEMTKATEGSTSTQQYVYSSNGKGFITKEKHNFLTNKKVNYSSTTTYSYNKKGNITTLKTENAAPTVYQYDQKGNLMSEIVNSNIVYTDGTPQITTYTNTYQGNRLISREIISNAAAGKGIATYQYKEISIDKDLVKTVESQQWMLLNNYLNNVPLGSIMID